MMALCNMLGDALSWAGPSHGGEWLLKHTPRKGVPSFLSWWRAPSGEGPLILLKLQVQLPQHRHKHLTIDATAARAYLQSETPKYFKVAAAPLCAAGALPRMAVRQGATPAFVGLTRPGHR